MFFLLVVIRCLLPLRPGEKRDAQDAIFLDVSDQGSCCSLQCGDTPAVKPPLKTAESILLHRWLRSNEVVGGVGVGRGRVNVKGSKEKGLF